MLLTQNPLQLLGLTQEEVMDAHHHLGGRNGKKVQDKVVARGDEQTLPFAMPDVQFNDLLGFLDPKAAQQLRSAAKIADFLPFDVKRFPLVGPPWPLTSNSLQLMSAIKGSRFVGSGLLLATDASVVDGRRVIAEGRGLYTSNSAVQSMVDYAKGRFQRAYSINPLAPNAIDDLKRAAEAGVKAVKLFFAIWGFLANGKLADDKTLTLPEMRQLNAFYDALADLGMVTIVHTSYEASIHGDEFYKLHGGDPTTLKEALFDRDITTVLAHTGGYMNHLPGFEHIQHHMASAAHYMKTYPNVYGDIAGALSRGYEFIGAFLKYIDDIKDKLIFGTDFSLEPTDPQVMFQQAQERLQQKGIPARSREVDEANSSLARAFSLDPHLERTKNPLDRYFLMMLIALREMGLSREEIRNVFTRMKTLIAQ
jgi:predicted TIM-barrel fold metal-dependent hydrolase